MNSEVNLDFLRVDERKDHLGKDLKFVICSNSFRGLIFDYF